jgi:hypothetical protein
MWRGVTWVRHLGNLTAAEKVEIEQEVQHATTKHDHGARDGCGGTATMDSPGLPIPIFPERLINKVVGKHSKQ